MITKTTPLGPNVKRLMIERASQLQVEATQKEFGAVGVGEIAAGIAQFGGAILKDSMKEAFDWTVEALKVLHDCPENAARWPTDEEMAGEILRQIAERRKRG